MPKYMAGIAFVGILFLHSQTRADVGSGLQIVTPEREDTVPPFLGDLAVQLEYPGGWNDLQAFNFGFFGTLTIVELTPRAVFINLGTMADPLIVTDPLECVDGRFGIVLADMIVRDETGLGGWICFGESEITSRLCFQTCDGYWNRFSDAVPFRAGTEAPCGQLPQSADCSPIAVEEFSWGRVKSAYR
jgi:hypothetical protein